jgi:acyl dehydratase
MTAMDPLRINATSSDSRRCDSRHFNDVQVGQELPELTIELTPTLIVATAIATRDFQDVHHDQDLARQRGSENIFMNILTSTGLVGRLVTDWAGPDAMVEAVDIRLGES